MLMGALILAGLVQGALDAQVILKGGGAAAAAAEVLGDRLQIECGRGHRFSTGCIAILMAETEPLMQAYYSHVKRRQAALMIDDQ